MINTVLCQDSTDLDNIPDESIHLVATSPPYNVGKAYDDDLNFGEYLTMLDTVFAETYRTLVDGGRVCINIANVGRKPYVPYHKFVIDSMLSNGFRMRGEIIWSKGAGAGSSTAWGSWKSATNPVLRDTHEYILVFSKGRYGRRDRGEDTITTAEFLTYTKSVWTFAPERAKRVRHPAPFPVELPYRCIQLYTFKGDTVLDPFGGSGTVAIASMMTGRNYILVDRDKEYVSIARDRVREYEVTQNQKL